MMCYNNAVKGERARALLFHACFHYYVSFGCVFIGIAVVRERGEMEPFSFKRKHIILCAVAICRLGNCFVSISACVGGSLETLKWMHKNFMRHLCEIKRSKIAAMDGAHEEFSKTLDEQGI